MKAPFLFVRRFASILALGCVLLAFSPAPQARAQKKMPPPVTLTPALLDQVEKVSKGLTADATALQELRALNHDDELDPTVADTDDAMVKKYPNLAKVYQAAGLKPHEFVGALITFIVADRTVDSPASSDEKMAQGNIDFVKANRDRVKTVIKVVTGRDE